MRGRVPVLRRLSEPGDGLHVVLRYTVAGCVDHAEFLFGIDVALRGGLADPRDALRLVLRISIAELVHSTDPVLRFGVAAFRERAILVCGGDIVLLGERRVAFLEAGDGRGRAQQERNPEQGVRSHDSSDIVGNPTKRAGFSQCSLA